MIAYFKSSDQNLPIIELKFKRSITYAETIFYWIGPGATTIELKRASRQTGSYVCLRLSADEATLAVVAGPAFPLKLANEINAGMKTNIRVIEFLTGRCHRWHSSASPV